MSAGRAVSAGGQRDAREHQPPGRAALHTRARIRLLLVATLAALAPASRIAAQEVGGSIEGTVVDSSGAALAEARVSVTSPALQGRRSSTTDTRGWFRLPLLPVGSYELTASRIGHRDVRLAEVGVNLGRMTQVGEIRLEPVAIEVAGAAVVAVRPRLGAQPPLVGGRLAAEAFHALPSDRDYQSIVTIMPHANASPFGDRANLAGTTGPESNYYVDGMNVVEPPGNGRSTGVPYNFVEEVEVRAGGYPAEFGGAGGGVVNAVTASGGNDFRGQLFGFYANRLFTSGSAASSVPARVQDFASWDGGGSFSGPLVRDRLWFFVAYDPTREREEVRLPGYGTHTDAQHTQRFAGKFTARLDDRTSLALSLLGDPSTRDLVGGVAPATLTALGNPDPMLVKERAGGASASLRATRILSSSAFAEFAVGMFGSRYSFLPVTSIGATLPLYTDVRNGYVEGGVGSITDRRASRTTARGSLAWKRANHSLKTGASWEDESFRETLTLNQVTRTSDTSWLYLTLFDRHARNHIRVPSAFAEDSWQATRRLRLEAGLRWSDEYWMASGGSVGQRIPGEWQPRAGLAWRLGRQERANLFASWGRFYQSTRLNVPGFFLQDGPKIYLLQRYPHDPRLDPSGGSTVFAQPLGHQPAVEGLRGASFDEVQAGAEQLLGEQVRVVVRGVLRTQRNGVVGVFSPARGYAAYGNPGSGELDAYPELARTYRAIEISMDGRIRGSAFGASYVLSSLKGNYEGYWDQTAGTNDPLGGASFTPSPATAFNLYGPLPGDRRHQFKGYASGALGLGFSAGATGSWSSGMPISELGSTPFFAPYYQFLSPRGSQGRTPSLYDLNLRLALVPPRRIPGTRGERLLADVYHVGNPRRAVYYDELHYRAVNSSGQQIAPNPNYGRPVLFQPPVAYRFGLEVNW